jgi:hypothetical protein
MMAASLLNPELMRRRQGRGLKLLFVPARVELSERDKHDAFAAQFNAAFEPLMPGLRWQTTPFVDLKLSYVPAYAYMEMVAAREPERASNAELIAQFSRLCARMANLAEVESALAWAYGGQPGDRYGVTAEETHAQFDDGGRAGMRELFSRLFHAGGIPALDADHVPPSVMERLIDAKLITGGAEISFTDTDAARASPRAQTWIREDQQLIDWCKGLTTLRQSWEVAGYYRKYLLS